MKRKILLVDNLHSIFKEEAERLGYEVDIKPTITREEAIRILPEYFGLVIRSRFKVDKEILDAASYLKFIGRAGAGMDGVDVDYAKSKSIVCLNASEGNRDAVAEHAIGMLLSLMNNLRRSDQQVRKGIWDREGNRGWELKGKTVGIVGYGNTGQALARKLSGFDVEVIAFDKYKTDYSDDYVKENSMEQIVKHSDIVSFHIPLTRETRQLVNDEYLYHFKKPIFLINTSRGEVVNTRAVLNGIKSGKILGAGLDVLETEKFPAIYEQEWYQDLAVNDNVILSPHVAGWTFESYKKISEVLAEKLRKL
ncbi:MAG: Phosphoglycerate dehydrogenase [Sphingobacteriales bacterium]|nr:Phosphoglycerate dehydrogenase [Sphingobacteriales bacterium]